MYIPCPCPQSSDKWYGFSPVTLISGIIIVLLFISEVRDFMTVEQDEELLVDTTRGEKLKINVDVIFHNIGCNCEFLSSVAAVAKHAPSFLWRKE